MAKYVIGIDFGTLSARALLVHAKTGEEIASCEYKYPHGVMDEKLPNGKKLDIDWALQHPQDYLDALARVVPRVLKIGEVSKDDVIGIGIDFTACTILPVFKDGTPLCFLAEFMSNEHSYVKLWKHHAAQDKANRINDLANERDENWLIRYGGKISSEWALPKLMEVMDEAPEIFEKMDYFIEAGDWLTWLMCEEAKVNACCAGYKGLWNKREGYPSKEFLKQLDPRLENIYETKLGLPVYPSYTRAGTLTERGAKLTTLNVGTPVSMANIDGHACLPAARITGPGKMLLILGTSYVHKVLHSDEMPIPGICGVVEDGILPGFYGYEAGQCGGGDHFAWFIENNVPYKYYEEAKNYGMDIYAYMRQKASLLKAGESGLVALDWWNGNRSVLVDADLSGLVVGMTLRTKPEEVYRALIEATAFGTKTIIDNFKISGIPITEIVAAGGIAKKDPLIMQILSDVTNMPISVVHTSYASALGSAIYASVAAGSKLGGYDDVYEAIGNMGKVDDFVYKPNPENAKTYTKLYEEYKLLHDYFGRGGNDVMKRLKNIAKEIN